MPIIHVHLMEGRSEDLKRRLIEELTQVAIDVINAPRESIRVLLIEIPTDSWGIGGKTARDLGR